VNNGAYLRGKEIVVRNSSEESIVCSISEMRLRGLHNVENALAASAISTAAGASTESIAAVLRTFTGVEHRIEPVREIDGVRFYNDSIATSPERAIAGLLSFDEPIVLIAGGMSKHLPLDEMAEVIMRKVKQLVLVGELGQEIGETMRAVDTTGRIPRFQAPRLAEGILKAAEVARPGDVVLLSPGGTSFDEFKDFEARGQFFKHMVNRLSPSLSSIEEETS
jgi:UDP-N-acetylmuramoylalanine--D-glutamate ligase